MTSLRAKWNDLLGRLEDVSEGNGLARAKCPVHGGRSRPLAMRLDAEKILVRCHAECSTAEVLAAIGLELHDLYPEREHDPHRVKNPWPAHELLRSVAYEATVVAVAAAAVNEGRPVSDADRARVMQAAGRIRAVARLAEGL